MASVAHDQPNSFFVVMDNIDALPIPTLREIAGSYFSHRAPILDMNVRSWMGDEVKKLCHSKLSTLDYLAEDMERLRMGEIALHAKALLKEQNKKRYWVFNIA